MKPFARRWPATNCTSRRAPTKIWSRRRPNLPKTNSPSTTTRNCAGNGRVSRPRSMSGLPDYKGVIRRTMSVERNLRPSFSVNLRRREDAFHAAFDAFCLRWNLFGMRHDEPLPLKLTVDLTPYGTMIHIPAYWSFDPKRDIRWDAIAKLHRTRVPRPPGRRAGRRRCRTDAKC